MILFIAKQKMSTNRSPYLHKVHARKNARFEIAIRLNMGKRHQLSFTKINPKSSTYFVSVSFIYIHLNHVSQRKVYHNNLSLIRECMCRISMEQTIRKCFRNIKGMSYKITSTFFNFAVMTAVSILTRKSQYVRHVTVWQSIWFPVTGLPTSAPEGLI